MPDLDAEYDEKYGDEPTEEEWDESGDAETPYGDGEGA